MPTDGKALRTRMLHVLALGPQDGFALFEAVRRAPEVAGQEAMAYAALYELERDGLIEARPGAAGGYTYRLTERGGRRVHAGTAAQRGIPGDAVRTH